MADRRSDKDSSDITVLEEVNEEMDAAKQETTDAMSMLKSAVAKYWLVILALALLLVSHRFALQLWYNTWGTKNSYYSHGPLVPLIAAFMLWANRKRIADSKIAPSWLGLALMLVAIPIFIFGHWSSSGAMLAATFFLLLVGATLLFFGIKGSRFIIFPLLYLVFMVPMPATILDEATFRVQLESTKVAAKMLDVCGYTTQREGTVIKSPEYLPQDLKVGEACSGFRLLISLLTFTVFFVYMVQAPAWKKAFLVLVALPLSLFINALRITMIGFAGIWSGSGDVMHEFHDWSGYLSLVICFVILFGIARLIRANEFLMSFPSSLASRTSASNRLYGGNMKGYAAVSLLALMMIIQLAVRPLDSSAKGRLNRPDMPAGFSTWISQSSPIDDKVAKLLWTADLYQRVFMDSDTGRQVILFAEAARDTTSFHDPHACLPGSGNTITVDRPITFKITRPRPLTIHATLLQASGDQGTTYVIHWYMIGDHSFANTPAIRRQVRKDQMLSFCKALAHPFDASRVVNRNEQYYWYRFSTDDYSGDSAEDVAALRKFIAAYFAHSRRLGQIEERANN